MNRFLPLLFLIGCATAVEHRPADYLPFEIARSWVYEIEDGSGSPFELSTQVLGGDIRDLADEEGVEFQMVYGRPKGAEHDITKSIYALASAGPREFYFDAMNWSLQHDPPIVLIPVDGESAWTGTVALSREGVETRALVRVEGTENLKIGTKTVEVVRVRTTYSGSELVVTRWFARGIGLVKMEVLGTSRTLGVRLLRYGSS